MSSRLVAMLLGLIPSVIQTHHRWVEIVHTPAIRVEVDTASISRMGGFLGVWERVHTASHRLAGSRSTTDRAIVRVEISCLGAEIRTVSAIFYNASEIVQFEDYDSARFAPVRRNSSDEAVYRYVCLRHAAGPM